MANYLEKRPDFCSQCKYFSKTTDNIGICRRDPPEIIVTETRYPVVRTDTLACGEGERSLPEMRELKGNINANNRFTPGICFIVG